MKKTPTKLRAFKDAKPEHWQDPVAMLKEQLRRQVNFFQKGGLPPEQAAAIGRILGITTRDVGVVEKQYAAVLSKLDDAGKLVFNAVLINVYRLGVLFYTNRVVLADAHIAAGRGTSKGGRKSARKRLKDIRPKIKTRDAEIRRFVAEKKAIGWQMKAIEAAAAGKFGVKRSRFFAILKK